jgi:glutamine amidotransferase
MTPPNVTIVDYQLGNLFSVRKACSMLGHPAAVSSDSKEISAADALILPGVGAFGHGMDHLHRLDLVEPIRDHVAAGKPLFGICLGLQFLFEESQEFGDPKGLGILKGSVRKFPVKDAPVPQIGWNRIQPSTGRAEGWSRSPLDRVAPGAWMYFVHSFYIDNADPADVLSETDYAGFIYTSAVLSGSVFATQYHPEKSSHEGLEIFRNWLATLHFP